MIKFCLAIGFPNGRKGEAIEDSFCFIVFSTIFSAKEKNRIWLHWEVEKWGAYQCHCHDMS